MAGTVNESAGARPGYGQLLRTRGAWTFLLPGFLARQPFAMLTIGILLLVQNTTGSYTTAGAVSATAGVSMALFAPQGGKLADRFGQAAVLLPGVVVHAAAISLLITLALSHAPLWALFAAAVPAGASTPQIGPMVRARWAAKLTGSPLMATSAAFESVTDEFTFVIGPVLATALCTGVHPSAGLVAEALLTVVGGLLFASQRRTQPQPGRTSGTGGREKGASALSVTGVRVLAVMFLGIGSVFGGMQMSMAAFTEKIGEPGLNGVLYGAFAAGNMIAGVVVGTVAWRSAPQRRLLVAYPLLTLATTPLWAAGSAPVLGALGLITGMCIAPALITGFTLVEKLVPAGARTEAFTWLTGSVGLGQAAGSLVAGKLIDKFGAHHGFLVPLCGTALALLVLLALRRSLTPPAEESAVAARGVGHREPVPVD
ncbi:MFS transporter [Streptomyces caatingaensis]|uniref:ABC transporter n=1 Tax=Streptomyces caatingaensis TaxID=1678637 RepID=A0A0K9XA29_9ACTN|nr:MFS transporter [Streptomyces caatingaensis]KNB50270.1 ABC transporter [Streptomyces caatingaensis]